MKHTPELITSLDPNQIFVFGSNLAGRHGAGAAKQAMVSFGAKYGVGEGLVGQSYAFPTLDENFYQRPQKDLYISMCLLTKAAMDNPNLEFLLTKVGCGLGGYEEDYMRPLFYIMPSNVIKPKGW